MLRTSVHLILSVAASLHTGMGRAAMGGWEYWWHEERECSLSGASVAFRSIGSNRIAGMETHACDRSRSGGCKGLWSMLATRTNRKADFDLNSYPLDFDLNLLTTHGGCSSSSSGNRKAIAIGKIATANRS